MDSSGGSVKEKGTGKDGCLYYVNFLKCGIEGELYIEAGGYAGILAGHGTYYRAKKINNVWLIKETGKSWTS
jgi:hypothetical protein